MSELTPAQIEAKLRELVHSGDQLLNEYWQHVEEYERVVIAAAQAEAEYRTNYASYFLEAEGAMDLRTNTAMKRCADEGSLHERKISAAKEKVAQQRMWINKAAMDKNSDDKSALQTLMRALVDEMRTAGYGTP